MKNSYNYFVVAVFLALVTLFYSCEKESELNEESNVLTQQLNFVESDYKSECIAIEASNLDGKVETVADNLVKQKIKNRLQEITTKERSYLKSNGNTVGVIMDGSCGNHKELTVFMDCEDGSDNNSDVTTDVGNITRDNEGNIKMHFCAVDGAYFRRTSNDYAVLCLTSVNPEPGTYKVKRYFDNEDDRGNDNYIIYNGIKDKQYGTFGSCYFSNNTLLSFYHYPKIVGSTNDYPDIGLSTYYVFGDFNNDDQGYVHFDDEDDSNANWCTREWLYYNTLHSATVSGDYSSIMEVDRNTRLYLSVVN